MGYYEECRGLHKKLWSEMARVDVVKMIKMWEKDNADGPTLFDIKKEVYYKEIGQRDIQLKSNYLVDHPYEYCFACQYCGDNKLSCFKCPIFERAGRCNENDEDNYNLYSKLALTVIKIRRLNKYLNTMNSAFVPALSRAIAIKLATYRNLCIEMANAWV